MKNAAKGTLLCRLLLVQLVFLSRSQCHAHRWKLYRPVTPLSKGGSSGSQFQRTITGLLGLRGGQSPSYPNVPLDNVNPQASSREYVGDFQHPTGYGAADDLFHETVQERVDKWKKNTQMMYQSPDQMNNPRDEQGRMKLLATVSKGSRAVLFFALMWRDVHLFETAEKALQRIPRLVVVMPLTLLFIANMAGIVSSLSASSSSAKKRMKAILNLDKLVEVVLLVWYLIRLTVAPSKYVPRDVFIANTLHSVFFLIQCQAFTRLIWEEPRSEPIAKRHEIHGADYGQVRPLDGSKGASGRPQPTYGQSRSGGADGSYRY